MTETLTGWHPGLSPFHPGEQAVQTRLGIRDKAENIGRRFIRPFMPQQHRDFYPQLPFILLGSVDGAGRPWASMVTGGDRFITAPDDRTLILQAQPLAGDRLGDNLQVGAPVGLLGIDLATRRRNRMNGTVTALTPEQFTIHVTQSYGNCPQFIQKRQLHWLPERAIAAPLASVGDRLTPAMATLITQADTLFIATSYLAADPAENSGVDVSHRGGKPGFVQVEGDQTLIFPDFAGNNFYNTLGNVLMHPQAGILFVDFATGDLLSLTGRAEIIWDGAAVAAFVGAERLLRITVEEVVSLSAALPWRWELEEYSPALGLTGEWTPPAG